MIWNCKKSVVRHGNRDIKHGDTIPPAVLKAMGEDRVKRMIGDGKISEGGAVTQDVTERDTLMATAKDMGLTVHHATGVTKLKELIDAEGVRLQLLTQAKEMKLDVNDGDDVETIKGLIDGEDGTD